MLAAPVSLTVSDITTVESFLGTVPGTKYKTNVKLFFQSAVMNNTEEKIREKINKNLWKTSFKKHEFVHVYEFKKNLIGYTLSIA